MLQCLRRTGHLPSFFVPTPGDLTAQETPPPGICHSRPKKWLMPGGQPGGAWVQLETSVLPVGRVRAGRREPLERGWREGRGTPRVSPSRAPVFFFAHYFQAPATQAWEYGAVHSHQDPPNPGKKSKASKKHTAQFFQDSPYLHRLLAPAGIEMMSWVVEEEALLQNKAHVLIYSVKMCLHCFSRKEPGY